MAVRSQQLGLVDIAVANTWTTVHTTPTGMTTIVKSVYLASGAVAPGLMAARIKSATDEGIFVISQGTQNVVVGWEGWVVMEPDDELQLLVGSVVGGTMTSICSGAVLLGT